ncbi:MurR/RpiR family transcriptional regulator [Trichococcus pasteurii]|nr:MurR/RpiR family transcriptional regulator [Trichococcus pasteurii]
MLFLNIISRMNQSHFFSNAENSIIHFLLENPDDLKNATTKDLATKTFTSPSTIVRLAQKLGFQGYNDFKIEFLAAVQQIDSPLVSIDANFPFKKADGITEISSNLSQLFVDAVKETNSLVDEDTYNQAINLLDQATFIDIYGVGSNQHLAYNFTLDMRRINKEVTTSTSQQEQLIKAATSNKDRVALIISYTGETKDILEICQLLKASETPMICISSVGNNSISDLCDITLNIVTWEKMFSKISTFSSSVSTLLVLDILYAGLFARNYDQNKERLLQVKANTTGFRSRIQPLIEDV